MTDITILNELKVKIFEFINLGLPSGLFSATIGSLLIPKDDKIELIKDTPRLIKLAMWSPCILNIYFEEYFKEDIDQFWNNINLQLNL